MSKLACLAVLSASLLLAPLTPAAALPLSQRPAQKITFELPASDQGIAGAEVEWIGYEFCIPATDAHVAEVEALDPSVQHFAGSRGRIGCRSDQYLCIGNTGQPNWRDRLMAIASLDYVERIDRFWGE